MQQSWIQQDALGIAVGHVVVDVLVVMEDVKDLARVDALDVLVVKELARLDALVLLAKGAAPVQGDSCALLGSPY